MKKRFTALAAAFFVFVASFSAYADPVASPAEAEIESVDIQSELGYVPSWSEAVQAVKDSRAAASASEAEIMTLDLDNDDYGIALTSSLGTVRNSVDRTAVYVKFLLQDGAYRTTYIDSSGDIRGVSYDSPIEYFEFQFSPLALPPTGTYAFSFDFSSTFSYTVDRSYFYAKKDLDNADGVQQWSANLPITQSSGDLYLSNYVVDVNRSNSFLAIRFYPSDTDLCNFDGSVAFNFKKSSAESSFSSIDVSSAESQEVYQAEVSSSLGSIGDTLEEIVETISLQLEALWNQMYNYIHLPEYEKLEQIRQAIENIRLDIDIDNSDVVNKLDEQISNDNANREQIINGYDSSASDTAESELDAALDIGKDSESEAMNSDAVNSFKEFEFPVPSENPPAVINACLFVGNYLQRLYTAIGIFNIPIDVSLVLIIAMLVIGFYRVRMRG